MADIVAMAEYESLCWVTRHATRHEARVLAREACGGDHVPLNVWRVTAAYMRPAKCPVHPDGRDPDAEGYDDCECFYCEEGLHWQCEKDHPDAFPVWRVEYTA